MKEEVVFQIIILIVLIIIIIMLIMKKNKKKKNKFFSFNLPFDIDWEKLKECLIKVKPEDENIKKIIELIENNIMKL